MGIRIRTEKVSYDQEGEELVKLRKKTRAAFIQYLLKDRSRSYLLLLD